MDAIINGEDEKLKKCAKILGCKPQHVEYHLRTAYEKIRLCNEILNPPLTLPPE